MKYYPDDPNDQEPDRDEDEIALSSLLDFLLMEFQGEEDGEYWKGVEVIRDLLQDWYS